MFDFLKKKIADFTGKIKDAIKAKPAQAPPKPVEAQPEQAAREPQEKAAQETAAPTGQKAAMPKPEEPAEVKAAQTPTPEGAPAAKEGQKKQHKQELAKKETPPAQQRTPQTQAPQQAAQPKKIETREAAPAKIIPAPKPVAPDKAAPVGPVKKTGPAKPAAPGPEFEIGGEQKAAIEKATQIREDERRELKAKVGLVSKIFGLVGGKIKITEKETQEFFEEFELSLLEADVQQDAAEAIVAELKSRLVGKEISSREDVTEFLKREVKGSLAKVMETTPINPLTLTEEHKPLKIMFFGPNGAGKTTSIAKIANYFMKKRKSVILAAGDTFRAASIEQLESHANALGVKVVKHKYGSDPAAVAFDAVKAAEAKGIDVVLIDTAGRQETNKNLIEELRKIERVIKPDLKLYVGEAFTGQALLQQATEFDRAIGLSGFVLTKIDNDAKGGTAISLLYSLKKPIVFVGTGQRYDDLLEFRPEFIIDRII